MGLSLIEADRLARDRNRRRFVCRSWAASTCWHHVDTLLNTGWLPTAWDSTQRRPNWYGLGQNTVCWKVPGSGPSLTLGAVNINAAEVVRVLGVLLTPDLSLDKHVTALSAKCFFQLRQLRRIRRSLDDDSIATLVHALNIFFSHRTSTPSAFEVITETRYINYLLAYLLTYLHVGVVCGASVLWIVVSRNAGLRRRRRWENRWRSWRVGHQRPRNTVLFTVNVNKSI